MALTAVAPASAAPGDIPGRGFLPDNRGWEMVSPLDKGKYDMPGEGYAASVQVRPDGGGIAFNSLGTFAGNPSGAFPSWYVARRGPQGWSTQGISGPTIANFLPGDLGGGRTANVYALDADLETAVVESNHPLGTSVPRGVPNLFSRDLSSGAYELLTPGGPTLAEAWAGGTGYDLPEFASASADMRHVIFHSSRALTPDAPDDGGMKLYESVDGSVRLASVLPGEVPASGVRAGAGPVGWHRAISADGARIFFATTITHSFAPLYVREGGTRTTQVTPHPSQFWTATPTGSSVLFWENTPKEGGSATNLVRHDVESGVREILSTDDEPADGNSPRVSNLVAASDDLSYVYFVANGRLVQGQPAFPGEPPSLYAWHDGETRYVTTLRDSVDAPFTGPLDSPHSTLPRTGWINRPDSSWTSDGKTIAFSTTARVSAYDSQGTRQVYRYDFDSDELECVSCPASDPKGDAHLVDHPLSGGTWQRRLAKRWNVSADGERVFFETRDRLVSADVNGKLDVYVWEGGQARLVSSGGSRFDSHFVDASPSGDDVFFATREQLVGWDTDSFVDIYDARAGGGFPEPARPPVACADDSCQGPATPRPVLPGPASGALDGSGDVSDGSRSTLTVGRLAARQRMALARGRTARLVAMVGRAGTVRVTARATLEGRRRVVAGASRRARRAGSVGLTLRLTPAGRRALAVRGRIALTVTTRFGGLVRRQTLVLRSPSAPRRTTKTAR